MIQIAYQCLLCELLVPDDAGGLGLKELGLTPLLDLPLAQPHLQVRNVVTAHAKQTFVNSLSTLISMQTEKDICMDMYIFTSSRPDAIKGNSKFEFPQG